MDLISTWPLYPFESETALRRALQGSEIKELIRRFDEAVGAFSTRGRTTDTRVFELQKSAT